jgi:hypothetical protein
MIDSRFSLAENIGYILILLVIPETPALTVARPAVYNPVSDR